MSKSNRQNTHSSPAHRIARTVGDLLLARADGSQQRFKWGAIAKCSPDTALRDINALMGLGVLRKAPGGGRSTAYELEA